MERELEKAPISWLHLRNCIYILSNTTVVEPANVVGRVHPRFAVAVIGNIIIMLTMSPPKSQPPISHLCYHQEDWHDNNSQSIVAYRSYGAYVIVLIPTETTQSVLLIGSPLPQINVLWKQPGYYPFIDHFCYDMQTEVTKSTS